MAEAASRQRLRAWAWCVACVLAACGDAPPAAWSGYVEGDYVHVGSPVGGTIDAVVVRDGDVVARGATLFTLDAVPERAARDEARSRLLAAEAQAQDTTKGRRPDEIAVTRAQRTQAAAQAALARDELARVRELQGQGFVSTARLDDAVTTLTQAQARVAELDAALAVAKLPAREDARLAAAAQAEAARQVLRASQWRERQTQVVAPVDAQVADTFFRAGEVVPAGQPVLSLLPAGRVKARFFVPEAEFGAIAVGQPVAIRCDGCGEAIAARISFVATRAEYTPPVIYSNSQRARLVFMVEARPLAAADAARLKPGQPVEVRRAAGAAGAR